MFFFRLYGTVALLFAIAGCSASSSSSLGSALPGAAGPPSAPGAVTASAVRLTVKIPTARVGTDGRRTQYVSPGSNGIAITAYNAIAPPPTAPSVALDISAANTSQCTTSSAGRSCTIAFSAPVGNDTIVAAVYDTAPSGGVFPSGAKVLSQVTLQTTIVAFAPNTVSLALGGSIASLSIAPSTISLAPQAGTTTVAVNALDAAGYTIAGSEPYATPINVSLSGTGSSAFTVSPTTLTAPGQTVSLAYTGAAFANLTLTVSTGTTGATASVQQGSGTVTIPVAPHIGTFLIGVGLDEVWRYPSNSGPTPYHLMGPTTPLSVAAAANGDVFVLLTTGGAYKVGVFFNAKAFGNVLPDMLLSDPVNFCKPQAIAVQGAIPSATLYVADACGKVLTYAVTSTGSQTLTSPTVYSAGGIKDPSAILADAAGNVLVADRYLNAVLSYPSVSPGSPVTALNYVKLGNGGPGPIGLAFDNIGGAWVSTTAYSGTGAIRHFPASGTYSFGSADASTTTCDGGQIASYSTTRLVQLVGCSSVANLYSVNPAASPVPINAASPPSFSGPDFDFTGSVTYTPSGSIFASSPALARVDAYTSSGFSSGAYVLGNVGLHAPQGIAVDAAGSLYVANGGTSSVSVYSQLSANGQVAASRQFYGKSLSKVSGIAVDGGGNVYVANNDLDVVSVYGPFANGSVTPVRQYNNGIAKPAQIAVDSNGTLYVANFSGGNVTSYPGTSQPSYVIESLSSPTGLALDTRGNIIVSSLVNGQPTISVYGPSGGTVLRTIAGTNTAMSMAGYLAVDQYDNILMNNGTNVLVFGSLASGNIAPIATFSNGGTPFSGGTGIAVQLGQGLSASQREPQAHGGQR